MQIELQSNVGLCGMSISASINRQKLQAASKELIGFLLWHNIASKLFGGGKKAEFARENAYSEAMGEKAQKVGIEILSKYFDGVSIKTFAFEKQSDESKFLSFCQKLGLDPAKAKSAWEQANAQAEEKPAETIE